MEGEESKKRSGTDEPGYILNVYIVCFRPFQKHILINISACIQAYTWQNYCTTNVKKIKFILNLNYHYILMFQGQDLETLDVKFQCLWSISLNKNS